ncbi:hypothetical protein I553_10657 [Mycobacterium xenopi 4042]|uniref:Uncharacterized protein n=1 Tax=Mycobacterium xenopi 4042 TaxID=1299334 RepID=X8DWK3_MYCXE|nr:hypothetical protein I553_10657 [Mycobacterium xenopi 4042]
MDEPRRNLPRIRTPTRPRQPLRAGMDTPTGKLYSAHHVALAATSKNSPTSTCPPPPSKSRSTTWNRGPQPNSTRS